MDHKKILKSTVLKFVRGLADEEVDWLISGLRSDEKGFDLKHMIAVHGPRVAIAQALIHIGQEEQAEGCHITMEEYFWFKHGMSFDTEERGQRFFRLLDLMERAFLEDRESDEALCLTAMAWSNVFLLKAHLRVLRTLEQRP
jgi:hypothetical protein